MLYSFNVEEEINENGSCWIVSSECVDECVGKGNTVDEALDDFERKSRNSNKK